MINDKIKVILTASAVFVLSGAIIFMSPSAVVAGDWNASGTIAGSPHDLSTLNSDGNNEVCVYCHTPHAASSGFEGAPLWNKAAADGGVTYQMYGATNPGDAMVTIGSTTTVTEPASPSLACLSCHDGVSAIDSIVNAPGSGTGALSAGAGGNTLHEMVLVNELANIGDTNASSTNVNLTNDHPVSIPYDDTKASLRDELDALPQVDGLAWVGATTVGDLLRGTDNTVECGSCHDPHMGYAEQGVDKQVNFLRYTNKNSGLCFGCHAK